jgi:hypothetical protein
MYAEHPQMAKEWEAHTPTGKLPEHVKKKKKRGIGGTEVGAERK